VRVITFKIQEDLLEKLDLYCANNGLFRSEAIREAVELYLSTKIRSEAIREAVELYLSTKKNSIEENL